MAKPTLTAAWLLWSMVKIANYFAKAKHDDPAYFEKGQQKLKDIEKVIQINKDKPKK